MSKLIINPVKLTFDPSKSPDADIREISEDYISRTIWMGIRQGHIVDQYFNVRCLGVATLIKKEMPGSPEKLRNKLEEKGLIGPNDSEIYFAKNLFQYLSGEKTLDYIVPL